MICAVFAFIWMPSAAEINAAYLREGQYLTQIAGCADCHTVNLDQPMAGGYRLQTPFGAFYTPNISPDKATGIGQWSKQEFRSAIREGLSPKGYVYYPAFPYPSFSKMKEEDIDKIFAYLQSLPPTQKQNRPHELNTPYEYRWLMRFWRWFFYSRTEFQANPTRSPAWNRGAYLVESLAHCGECHTPRDFAGVIDPQRTLSGSDETVQGLIIPNITPDSQTGLGHWSKDDWVRYLSSGFTPEFKTSGAEMAHVLRNTAYLSREDREAIAEYLMSLKPIRRSFYDR